MKAICCNSSRICARGLYYTEIFNHLCYCRLITESCFAPLQDDLQEFLLAPRQTQAMYTAKRTETLNPASGCSKGDPKRYRRPNHKYIDTQFYLENLQGMENESLLLGSVCLPLFVVSHTVGKLWFP